MCFSKRFFAHSEYPYTPSGRRKRFLHLNATAPYLLCGIFIFRADLKNTRTRIYYEKVK